MAPEQAENAKRFQSSDARQPRPWQLTVTAPDGSPVRWPFELSRSDCAPIVVQSGAPILLPANIAPGFWQLSCSMQSGKWRIEIPADASAPIQPLTLALAELLVWLSDPGGRDFGGLSVMALSSAGEARSRVGIPFSVWAGKHTLVIGNPVAGVALRRLPVEVRPSRTTLELGRLGALVLRFQKDHGWPVQAHRMLGNDNSSDASLPAPGGSAPVQPTSGRTNEPLLLWPGFYRLAMEEGPELELEVRGGQLTEITLPTESSLPELMAQLKSVPAPAATQALRELLGSQAKKAARSAVRSGLAGPLERLGITLQTTPTDDDDYGFDTLAPGKAPAGPAVLLRLLDPRGYDLAGHPYVLTPLSDGNRSVEGREQTPVRGRIGRWCAAPEGLYRVQLDGLLPFSQPIQVRRSAEELTLPPLSGLEVILRDGNGCSLRGASLVIVGESGHLTTAFSQLQLLEAGQYRLSIPTRPPLQRFVELKSGDEQVVDLGALAQLDTTPGEQAPWGTPIRLELVQLADSVLKAGLLPATPGGNALKDPAIHAQMGQTLHVPPGAYRFWLGGDASEGELLELRPGRVRRPSVVGRGMEALANDDANQK